ncbi:DinB family protein [uncultured Paludibaculum sp.]|uniref:DinB family protein n=1 Tax=uncultured Paludibaculum sp. TaxID=1765020 RepID=UPI002AAB6A94|nr:DinB family protein [uncultured Paludibaculum sp.]
MTTHTHSPKRETAHWTTRAGALADRLERGARALADLVRPLSDAQWQSYLPGDGRTIGVVVHHVASVYPLEIELALKLAGGQAITGVTMVDVDAMNARHAAEHSAVTKAAALDLLERNSAKAAASIRTLSDEDLAQAAPVSLYADAPLTCQFLLEDHAVRHSYHHLAGITRRLQGIR